MKQRKAARKNGTNQRRPIARASRKVANRPAAAKKPVAGPLALPAACVIDTVEVLRSDLLSRFALAMKVTLDATALQRIDTACLQVLASFARDRRAAGLPFEWTGVPDALTDAAALLDLTATLGLAGTTDARVPA